MVWERINVSIGGRIDRSIQIAQGSRGLSAYRVGIGLSASHGQCAEGIEGKHGKVLEPVGGNATVDTIS